MKITIDFPYETVNNIINALYSIDLSKEDFYLEILDDLYSNYLWIFCKMHRYYDIEKCRSYIKSIISESQLEVLYRLYLENKDYINSEIFKRQQKLEIIKNRNMKTKKEIKKFYTENYKPNKNAKPVTYNGTEYLSKAQCIALEGITRKELEEYLKSEK